MSDKEEVENRHPQVNISRQVFYHIDHHPIVSSTAKSLENVSLPVPLSCCQISAILKRYPRDFQVFEVKDEISGRGGKFLNKNVIDIGALCFDSPPVERIESPPSPPVSTSVPCPLATTGSVSTPDVSIAMEIHNDGGEPATLLQPETVTVTLTPFCAATWMQSLPGDAAEQVAAMNERACTGKQQLE